MKKFLVIGLIMVSAGLFLAFVPYSNDQKIDRVEESTVKWMTFEEAVKASETTPKKIMIDLYTDWCGWCKRMDATTFEDPKVAKYLNDNFYAVKFDAEQKEETKNIKIIPLIFIRKMILWRRLHLDLPNTVQ